MSDYFALSAIRLLWRGLEPASTNGADTVAREQVMLGATFEGLAFGVAGTAAAHAIQHPVGALTHTAHGAGVACLMLTSGRGTVQLLTLNWIRLPVSQGLAAEMT